MSGAPEAGPSPDPAVDEHQLSQLFDQLDGDGNGLLEQAEVEAALRRLGLPAGAAYMAEWQRQYDKDASRTVDFQEFRRYVQSKERRIRAAFRSIDADADGQLDAGEVHAAAQALGLSVAPGEAERMVSMLDADGDGLISYGEFRRFVVMLPGAQLTRSNIMWAWLDSSDWLDGMEYRLGHMPPSQPLERLLAGGVAGAVSRTVVAPLERLRTIMMADSNAGRIGPVLRRMWADGGVRGLFRGNLASVVKVFPSSAIQFAVYDACKDVMQHFSGPGARSLSTAQKLGAGMVAGATACAATYPLEALRTQLAVAQAGSGGAGYLSLARLSLAERGVRGLYQGFSAGLLNSSCSMALGFASYEVLCTQWQRWRGTPPSTEERGLCGGGAAFATTGLTMPLENVARRLQAQGRPGFPRRYSGSLDCAAQMLRGEGLAAFWRGSLSSFAKVVPSVAATRLLYESIVELRGIGGVRRYRADASC
ncbi:calcium-binding mitochondrial carrier S -1 [Micractinium conductrix]|uniref:Calcium-binding mitochondrial carrier S -1 n=1 Tax=Micractinium conductrix TaxID=554055 RepID=A0A2P6VQK4_9CHLO|nr:calcium-binding mitochondrial carrier S -1 [Micractinium conductrix]|eukprot:PSC76347.1 calcium-binding mitochondrial carrier S -1 [Micractinium conductrix]